MGGGCLTIILFFPELNLFYSIIYRLFVDLLLYPPAEPAAVWPGWDRNGLRAPACVLSFILLRGFMKRPFHKTLPRSSATVGLISVRFYETGCVISFILLRGFMY